MTHCPSCAFQYRLKLQRILDTEASARSRRFMQMLAAQTLGCFVVSQLTIISLGCLIRALDPKEVLVKVFNLPQDEGYAESGDFVTALRHHKLTYYIAGVLAALALIGVATTFAALAACCSRGRGARGEGATRQVRGEDVCGMSCDLCCECCRVRYTPYGGYYTPAGDCVYCCAECCDTCCQGGGGGGRSSCDCPDMGGSRDNPLIILFVVVILAFVIIGLFAAIVALVTAIQKAVQKYAQLQQLRMLTQEYIVEDLADPKDLGEAKAKAEALGDAPGQQKDMSTLDLEKEQPLSQEALLEQSSLQRQIADDMMDIFGVFDGPERQPASSAQPPADYGSTA